MKNKKMTYKHCRQFILIFLLAVFGGLKDTNAASISELKKDIEKGSPLEKENAISVFMKENQLELVPVVIEAILDATSIPKHGDTGWATVHHQAAWAMGNFAKRIDGVSIDDRGKKDYTFFDDGGAGTLERRKLVYNNWLKWWNKNKK